MAFLFTANEPAALLVAIDMLQEPAISMLTLLPSMALRGQATSRLLESAMLSLLKRLRIAFVNMAHTAPFLTLAKSIAVEWQTSRVSLLFVAKLAELSPLSLLSPMFVRDITAPGLSPDARISATLPLLHTLIQNDGEVVKVAMVYTTVSVITSVAIPAKVPWSIPIQFPTLATTTSSSQSTFVAFRNLEMWSLDVRNPVLCRACESPAVASVHGGAVATLSAMKVTTPLGYTTAKHPYL